MANRPRRPLCRRSCCSLCRRSWPAARARLERTFNTKSSPPADRPKRPSCSSTTIKMVVPQDRAQGETMSNFKVGYGNPPAASRFRPGVSGNPKGRPKREKSSVAEHIESLLDTPIEYREDGKSSSRPIGRLLSERSSTMPSAAILAPPLWSSGSWGAPSALAVLASTTFSSRTGCPTTLIKRRAKKPRISPPAAIGAWRMPACSPKTD